MRLDVIINCRAGALIGANLDSILAGIRSEFAVRHDVEIVCSEPAEMLAHLDAAIARRPDIIVVGGGDGTVRAAAERLVDGPIALGIIPLGTMNRLARDLAIPLDAVAASRVLASGSVEAIDVAEVNNRIFLCNSLIGLPAQFAKERQALRGKPWRERASGYARILRSLLGSTRRLKVEIDDGQRSFAVRALSLAVSNNAYSEEPSLMLTRRRLDAGQLGLYVAKHKAGWRLFGTIGLAMLGRWRRDRDVLHLVVRSLKLSTRSGHLRVSNDGELEDLETPLTYHIRAKSLKMLVPRT